LELLAFNAQIIKGHLTMTTPTFREFFSGVMSGLYLGSCVPNFKGYTNFRVGLLHRRRRTEVELLRLVIFHLM